MPTTAGTAQLVHTPTILVDSQELPHTAMLAEARISQTIGSASRLELRFYDDNFVLVDSSTFAVGGQITVAISNASGAETPAFAGEITAIGIEQAGDRLHQLVVEAFDRRHRLNNASTVKTYVKMKDSEIASQIAGRNGLSAQVTATTVTHEYILQQCSDAAMLDRIAFRTGMEWFVDDRVLIMRERPTEVALTVELGIDMTKFRARYTAADNAGTVTVRGWDSKTKAAMVGTDSTSSNAPAGASKPAGLEGFRSNASSFGDRKLTTAALHVESQAEAEGIAKSLAIRNAGHDLVARGELVGTPALKAGTHITVKGVGTKMGGDYYVTAVEHIFGNGDLVSRFTAGGSDRESIVDLLGSTSPQVGGWTAGGLVVGVVTNLNDPDNMNRIKVKFPALSDEDESYWARMASPMAGAGAGMSMMPAINDEVIVGFEHGDTRRAVILGALWNGKDAPPKSIVDGKVEEQVIQTVGGHVLSFNEKDGSEKISLIHGKQPGTKLVLEKEKVQLMVAANKMIEIDAGPATIVLDGGKVTVTADTITLKGNQAIKMEAPQIEIKAASTLKLDGGVVDVKGKTGTVDGGGMLTLKGGQVLNN